MSLVCQNIDIMTKSSCLKVNNNSVAEIQSEYQVAIMEFYLQSNRLVPKCFLVFSVSDFFEMF